MPLLRCLLAACVAVAHTQAQLLLEVYKPAGTSGALVDFPDYDALTPKLQTTASQVLFTESDLLALEPLAENFAVRLTGTLQVPTSGMHTFYLTSDDGSQLILDGAQVVDNGGTHFPVEMAHTVYLDAGPHSFELQYFQFNLGAGLVLEWDPPGGGREVIPALNLLAGSPPPAQGLLAEVVAPGQLLTDFPDFTASLPASLTHTSGLGFPSLGSFAVLAPGVPLSVDFAVRFTASLRIETAGLYTFSLTSDDGSQLLIDGAQVVDNGGAHFSLTVTGSASLSAGWHTLEVQYFQRDLGASLDLEWTPPGGVQQPLPGSSLWLSPGDLTDAPPTPLPTPAPTTSAPPTPGPTAPPTPAPPTANPPPPPPSSKPTVELYKAPAGVEFLDVPEFDVLSPVGLQELGGYLAFTEAELLSLQQASGAPLGDVDFALRIEGSVHVVSAGLHTFFLTSDDGAHLFVGGRQVINNNGAHFPVELTGSVVLGLGWHAIEVHYSQRDLGALLTVEWVQPGAAREVIPAGSLGASSATAAGLAQQFAVEGRVWGTKQFGLVPVHMAVVPDGRVFAFGSSFGSSNQVGGDVTLWDPPTNTFQFISDLFVFNTFCSAVIYNTYEENIAVVGGNTNIMNSDQSVSFFDYQGDTVTGSAPLAYPRWYATLVLLHDGRIVTLGGIVGTPPPGFVMTDGETSEIPEIYTPWLGTWETLDDAGNHDAFGLTRQAWWYPRGYAAPPHSSGTDDTKVFGVSGEHLWVLDVAGTGSVSVMQQTLGWYAGASCGSVMYTPGAILVIGGGQETNGDIAVGSNNAAIVEYDSATSTVTARAAAPMTFGRNWVTAVVVPSGEVVALGGTRQDNSYATGVWVPDIEVWTPPAGSTGGGSWRTVAKLNKPRLYHSSAVLLPDARILMGGSGNPPFDNSPASFSGVHGGEVPAEPIPYTDVEIYTPWYLYSSSGGFADRPVVTYTGPQPGYGADLVVTLQDASHVITGVSCITLPAVTHCHNTAQTFINLAFAQVGAAVTITIPQVKTTLPPGGYYIFVVNSNGVPSKSLEIDGSVVLKVP